MANQDNEFNFYNSENDGYRGGFGGYTDSNPNQSQGGPEAPQGPQKHRGSGRRIAALILACAVVGGGAGVGGAALYSSVFASQPSVIYQNTQPILIDYRSVHVSAFIFLDITIYMTCIIAKTDHNPGMLNRTIRIQQFSAYRTHFLTHAMSKHFLY